MLRTGISLPPDPDDFSSIRVNADPGRSGSISKYETLYTVQGADDKLGQFLDQDIEALANHRNVLRHSLESCPSLV